MIASIIEGFNLLEKFFSILNLFIRKAFFMINSFISPPIIHYKATIK